MKKKKDPELAIEQRLAQQRRHWGARIKEQIELTVDLQRRLRSLQDTRDSVDAGMAAIRDAKTRAAITRDLCARFKWPESGPFFAGLVEGLAEAERLLETRLYPPVVGKAK